MSPDIEQFNTLRLDNPLKIKKLLNSIDVKWNIPLESINYRQHILTKLENKIIADGLNSIEIETRLDRVLFELQLWEDNNLHNLLKALIYIIRVFRDNNIVWGVGRGSSCCCYILYLIGLHEVDSVLYDLDLNEFFRDEQDEN
jgi:DNA polymerase III alpha subunit